MKIKKLLITFTVIVISCIALRFLANVFTSWSCGEPDHINKVISPDGKYSAEVIRASCGGAAGDIYTNVMVAKVEGDKTREMFFNNDQHTSVLTIAGYSDVNLKWINNKKLFITSSNCVDGESKKDAWTDVEIIHEEKCS